MNQFKTLSAATVALLFFAACGSMGGLDDVLGGSQNARTNEIRGTVSSVDNQSVLLTNVSGYQTMLSSSGNDVRVYYDDRTTVEWEGEAYHPTALERGDEVIVTVDESGNRLMAERMRVTHNVSAGMTSSSSSTMPTTIRGTVRYVDTNRRTIEVETNDNVYNRFNPGTAGANVITVHYDQNVGVEFGGRMHPVGNLERGDVIEVQLRDTRSGLVAERVFLVRDVRGMR